MILLKELKQSFEPLNLLLTSAIGKLPSLIDDAYDIPNMSKYLDYFHIMTWDYGGAWDGRITANAPLHGDGTHNVRYTIEYFFKSGAPASKLVLGMPFYGRTFVTTMEGISGDPTIDAQFTGPYSRENGFMGYNEICEVLSNKSSGWTQSWDERITQGIARFRDEAKGQTNVVVYDSPRSIANKVRYAVRKNLAGVVAWSIDTDDFHGDCGKDADTFVDVIAEAGQVQVTVPTRTSQKFPLLQTINEGITIATEAQSVPVDEDCGRGFDCEHIATRPKTKPKH